ncbi:MAG: PAS domain-containing sensor histidine kinase, partial [Proteobacteria bacterium]|nr:PAS domain-containing sensor histidine kinase [Pseudomonadota bacterium]
FAYHRAQDRAANAPQWLRWLTIAALANGANWGFAGSVFFPSHTDEQQIFLAFMLSGMAAGGISIYAGSWRIFAMYAAGILAPFTYVLATFGNRLFIEIALMVPMFYGVTVAIAYHLEKVFHSGYRLRHAYGRLTEDYSILNGRLENQLVELADARRQVEASGRKLALFSESSPIPIFEFDPMGRVVTVNPEAENLFGHVASEVVGHDGTAFLFPNELSGDVVARWREFIRNAKPLMGLRYHNVRRDGSEIVCEWSLTPLVGADGKVISVIIQGNDITKQLEVERMKKEFMSTLSHELRTPLTSIIGSLQLVNSGVLGDVASDVTDLTTIAERNGERLLDMINDILDIEKIESGKFTMVPEVVAVDSLVRESISLNQSFAERHKTHFDTMGELPAVKVHVDRKRLLQVLTNLLSNAAKFSPEGETVDVSVDTTDARVRVEVHDRGPGIPENFRDRIFSRFSQADSTTARQKGGTGLGLAICKHMIEMMQGEIGFSDRSGGGTTFWFELPKHSA